MGRDLKQRVQSNAARQQGSGGIAQFIHDMTPEIGRALPKHMNADRVARLALTAVRKDVSLAACTPESFAGALITASSLGLEPNTPAGEAYLVAYEDKKNRTYECQLIIGYQGMTKLFYQHPLGKHISAHVVREGDEFDYAYGLAQFLRHKPLLGNKAPIVAYYAVGELTSGASDFVVLSPEEVSELRGGGGRSRIADPQLWRQRKTALRQLLKMLPKSTEMSHALAADEQFGSVLAKHQRSGEDLSALTGPPVMESVESMPGSYDPMEPDLPDDEFPPPVTDGAADARDAMLTALSEVFPAAPGTTEAAVKARLGFMSEALGREVVDPRDLDPDELARVTAAARDVLDATSN